MALKARITKEEHAKLSETIRGEYIEDGDGFKLDIEGAEDTGALKRAKDRESERRVAAEAELRELRDAEAKRQQALDDANTELARKNGDIKTLESAWERKASESKAQYEGRIGKLQETLSVQLVDNVAMNIASKLSTSAPKLLIPHIKARLKADFEGEAPSTKFLDADGKVSDTLNAEGLYNEFLANKDFAPIITVSKTSGGAGSNKGGGAPTQQHQQPTTADLSKMNPAQMAAHIKESKASAQE